MKSIHYVLGTLAATCALSGSLAVGGCSSGELFGEIICDPTPFEPSPLCVDAGADATTDSGEPGQSAINDPGLDMQQLAPCPTGRCLPTPTGFQAGLWSEAPVSVWFGPAGQAPAKCPDDPVYGVPNEKFHLFDKLIVPPTACPTCSCGPSEGTCTGAPETIELRAGKCGQSGVIATPFDSPTNWDGSCTNADSIAAGAKCPTGSQNLCAQSVHSSTLPPPNDSCKPSANGAAVVPESTWEIEARVCHGNTQAQSCGSEALKKYCVNDAGPGWLQCTYRSGDHKTCPDNYQHRQVLYPQLPVDTRGCSACECGTPTGSGCLGGLSLSSDATCVAELVNLQVGSMGPICYDFLAPGLAIGSKAIVNRTYLPGMCAASGGQPIGDAEANVNQAVTFCCLEPLKGQKVPG